MLAENVCEIKIRPINQIPPGQLGDTWLVLRDGHHTNGIEQVYNSLDQTLQAGRLYVARFNINEMRFEAAAFNQTVKVPVSQGTLDTLRLLGVKIDGT
jgi:hypothetical protein